jgi:competence protein ComEA
MIDARVKIVIGVLVAALAGGSGYKLYADHHAPPPVVITSASDSGNAASTLPDALPNRGPAHSVTPAGVASSDTTTPQAAAGATDSETAPTSPPPPASSGGESAPPPQPPAGDSSPATTILVHVAGAVKNAGLCKLPAGSRVDDAVKAAGGPTATADLNAVNLAEAVTDGEKVYIPHKGEAADSTGAGNTIGYASPSSAGSTGASSATPSDDKSTKGDRGGREGRSGSDKLTDPSQGTVNINTASAAQLQRLPGIGPALAGRIIAFRQQNGRFKSIDDLTQVSGIGDKKLAKMRPFIRL